MVIEMFLILGAAAVLCHNAEKAIDTHLQAQEDWDWYNDHDADVDKLQLR